MLRVILLVIRVYDIRTPLNRLLLFWSEPPHVERKREGGFQFLTPKLKHAHTPTVRFACIAQ